MLIRETFKIAIIGLGRVGTTTAFSLLLHGIPTELVLLSRDLKKAEAEKLDLEHGEHFYPTTKITASDNYNALKHSDLVIITAGCPQKPGETRLDLAKTNCEVVETIGKKIKKYAPRSLVLVISNPVDILTYKASQITRFQFGRVFGSGTLLDTMRYRFHLGEALDLNPSSIHAYVLGEHGDRSFPVLSAGTIGGVPIRQYKNLTPQKSALAYKLAKDSAYNIISGKGSTYYGIAVAATHIANTIKSDAKKILPLSIPHPKYQTAISLPCVVGRSGVEQVIDVPLSGEEEKRMEEALTTLDAVSKQN